jgi:hypothetical protein
VVQKQRQVQGFFGLYLDIGEGKEDKKDAVVDKFKHYEDVVEEEEEEEVKGAVVDEGEMKENEKDTRATMVRRKEQLRELLLNFKVW